MKVHVFEGKKPNYGFTSDATGSNLPPSGGPWKHFKDMELKPGQKLIGVDSDDVINGVAQNGYFVTGARIESKEG